MKVGGPIATREARHGKPESAESSDPAYTHTHADFQQLVMTALRRYG